MMNLSNPVCETLTPEMLSRNVALIGYEVLVDGRRYCLAPTWDSIGLGARPGDEVEISSLGLGTEGVVIRRLKGYRHYYKDDRLEGIKP